MLWLIAANRDVFITTRFMLIKLKSTELSHQRLSFTWIIGAGYSTRLGQGKETPTLWVVSTDPFKLIRIHS